MFTCDSQNPHVKIIDFHSATFEAQVKENKNVFATPGYLAPEVLNDYHYSY
jgi:serine/threonine protein kinase